MGSETSSQSFPSAISELALLLFWMTRGGLKLRSRPNTRITPFRALADKEDVLRNEEHERMLLGFGIDLKTTRDDDCVVISPVSKVKYVDHSPPAPLSSSNARLLPLPDSFRICSASESCRSVADGLVLPKLVSLAMRGRCRFTRGDDSGGAEGDRWARLNWVRGSYQGGGW